MVAGHIKSSECLGETETRSRDDGLLCCKTRFPTERKAAVCVVFFPFFLLEKKMHIPKWWCFFLLSEFVVFFLFFCLFVVFPQQG